jgi:hypothetical protein
MNKADNHKQLSVALRASKSNFLASAFETAALDFWSALDSHRWKQCCTLAALATCALLLVTGCTGPGFLTAQPGSTKIVQPVPQNAKLFIKATCQDSAANAVVQAKLAPVLAKTGKFSSVEYGTATPESLQLTIEVVAKRSSWQRRYNGDFSYVSADGSIVSDQTTLVVFHEHRSGTGGTFGGGGLLACGEDTMVRTLTGRVIEDLADALKKAPAPGK